MSERVEKAQVNAPKKSDTSKAVDEQHMALEPVAPMATYELRSLGNPNSSINLKTAQPQTIRHLQRTLGNHAVHQMLASGHPSAYSQPKHPARSIKKSPYIQKKRPENRDQSEVKEQEPQELQGAITPEHQFAASPPDVPPANITAPLQRQRTATAPSVQRVSLLERGAKWAFEKAVGALGGPGKMVLGLLKNAGGAFMNIVKNPAGFLKNLIGGVKNGFSKFSTNILKHLKAGFMGWLFGTVAKAGLQIPKDFSPTGIFTLVTQIIGLTVDKVKERLAKFIGQKNAARLQKAMDMLQTFIGDGVGGLWKLVKNKLSDLKNIVVEEIQKFVVVKVVQNAVMKIASMFNPASGIAAVIMSVYNIVQWLINNGSRLAGLFKAVSSTVSSIASGATGVVANKIESILAKAIPVAIGFFASLLGIGGLANKIANIVKKVQKRVQDAIDAVIQKIASKVKKLFSRLRGDRQGNPNEQTGDSEQLAKARAVVKSKQQEYLASDGRVTKDEAQKIGSEVKQSVQHLKAVHVKDGENTWDYNFTFIQRSTDPDISIPQGSPEATEVKLEKYSKQAPSVPEVITDLDEVYFDRDEENNIIGGKAVEKKDGTGLTTRAPGIEQTMELDDLIKHKLKPWKKKLKKQAGRYIEAIKNGEYISKEAVDQKGPGIENIRKIRQIEFHINFDHSILREEVREILDDLDNEYRSDDFKFSARFGT